MPRYLESKILRIYRRTQISCPFDEICFGDVRCEFHSADVWEITEIRKKIVKSMSMLSNHCEHSVEKYNKKRSRFLWKINHFFRQINVFT